MKTLSTLKSTTLAIALVFGVSSFQAIALDSQAVEDSMQNDRFSLEAEFKNLDTDSNASLSQTEFSKDKFFTKGHFAKADTDQDGVLSQEEYVTYKSGAQKNATKRVVSDTVITSKAKANLLAERNFKSTQISVKTFNGVVILSGFVDDELSKTKAEAIVNKVEGVKSIKNGLVVKQ